MANHRSADQWRTIFSEFHQSELSITAFCQQQHIATSNFYTWRKKLGVPLHSSLASSTSNWHAIEPVAAAPATLPGDTLSWDLELSLPGGTVLRLRH